MVKVGFWLYGLNYEGEGFFHMNTMKLMFQASFFGREIQGIVLPQRCLKRPGEAMIGFFPPGDGEARPWRGSQT